MHCTSQEDAFILYSAFGTAESVERVHQKEYIC